MSRKPIQIGDHVTVGMIGTTKNGEPFPYWFDGKVVALHDEHVTVSDETSSCWVRISRERVITDDQFQKLKRELLDEMEQ